MSAKFFRKNSGNYALGVKLAGFTWGIAIVLPLAVMIVLLFRNHSVSEVFVFVLFALLTPVNLFVHKKTCEKCKLRFVCPASMAKKQG